MLWLLLGFGDFRGLREEEGEEEEGIVVVEVVVAAVVGSRKWRMFERGGKWGLGGRECVYVCMYWFEGKEFVEVERGEWGRREMGGA